MAAPKKICLTCVVCYEELPLYEDGVTTNSTFALRLSSPTRYVTLQTLLTALKSSHIEYTVDLKTERVRVEFMHWDKVLDMMMRQEWEMDEESTPLFVIRLLDHYRKKRREVSMEEIREKITPMIFDCLRPYQQTLVKIAVERNDQYIADDMGTGKTYTALAIARYWNERTVVITMPNIMYNWRDEIVSRMDWEEENIMVCRSSLKVMQFESQPNEKIRIMIVPYGIISNEQVRNYLKGWAKMMILDECHSVKNLSAARTRAVLNLAPHMMHKVILSGSPFEKSHELYSQMKVLDPQVIPPFFHYNTQRGVVSHDDFASRYCKPSRVQFKGSRPQWEFKGNEHQEELKVLVAQFMVRRLKRDVCTQLPAKIRHRHDLPEVPGADIMNVLKEMNAGKLVDRSKYVEAIELTCDCKLPSVIEYVKGQLVSNQKSVVFFHHMKMKEALMALCNELQVDYIMIDGSVSAEKRHELQGRFQKDVTCRVALLSIKASGTGTNFTAASNVIMTEILPTAADMFQAEDRCHRMGQESTVNVTYLVLPKSVDETHVNLIIRKFSRSSAVMDQEKQTVDMKRKRTLTVSARPE
jgi:SWI/SNF-related matrix-associated actin-dependent regulator 1 of chromatin subfamily A